MSLGLFLAEKNRILRVAELNFAIKQLLESGVPLLWVRGEISNLAKAASGHFYFSLKDDRAQVRCVMFRHKNQFLSSLLGNGQQVEVLAAVTLYEPRGDFQLTVEQVRPAGMGVLYEQFARLKQKLEGEGLFDPARKRPLPRYPKCIGIITSPQAAALRDVLATLRLRQPAVPVVLYPASVQGTGSAEQIAAAIRTASRRAECDVLIVCRGGGSIEDLWSFNEEVVARAIATSAIPVVSGVGHETDFTIADFVADERAPTPTAAAQHVVPDRHALQRTVHSFAQHLRRALSNRLQNAMQAADYLQRRLLHPAQQLRHRMLQLEQLQQRMQRAHGYQGQQRRWQWQTLAQRMTRAMCVLDAQRTRQMENLAQHLGLLDPKQVLARGYSVVRDTNGCVVSDAGGAVIGAELHITFARGWAHVEVKEKGGGQ